VLYCQARAASRITDVTRSRICDDSDEIRDRNNQKSDVTDLLSSSPSNPSYIETEALTTHDDDAEYSPTSATQASLIQQSCEKYREG